MTASIAFFHYQHDWNTNLVVSVVLEDVEMSNTDMMIYKTTMQVSQYFERYPDKLHVNLTFKDEDGSTYSRRIYNPKYKQLCVDIDGAYNTFERISRPRTVDVRWR